ncbi:Gfo/Idh/MocA family protein [Aestuariivivens sediminicola]|uniref:Gfo/Idh/MocA family protein n=1 Tax=Aestuariivivens sediminicola TaxID=2913560 RepID=UPI001F5647D7|nr:Gfo/Idh/MocA family oxidoreductase [Aestuariivivens sediminicola]
MMINSRRKFLASISMLAASSVFPVSQFNFGQSKKLRIVLVGTGIRGTSFWGKRLVEAYSDILEFVGLSDINPGRLEYAKRYIGVDCPVFLDFDDMLKETKPDLIIVTTVDSTHHQFIVKGLNFGCDVLTEKPLSTDEWKIQEILKAEKSSGRKLIVGFNYRWSPYNTKIKELLMNATIGQVTSVDFHWYLNTYHGASYFRRWHGLMDKGGSLWVHKATHHFDLMNWWLNSDPYEVFAYGSLEHYGKNGPFRGEKCRTCEYKNKCDYYFDISKDQRLMDLYVANETYDGYIRDNCLFREEIDIYDKMSAQIKYANNVTVNYSLTTYSPFEGWRIAFNGTKGRIEASLDIPYNEKVKIDQAEMHAKEMEQNALEEANFEDIIVHKLWNDYDTIKVKYKKAGHGGGDQRLHDKIFKTSHIEDPYQRAAGSRDGAMSAIIGIAARKSIAAHKPIRIEGLTDIKPSIDRT